MEDKTQPAKDGAKKPRKRKEPAPETSAGTPETIKSNVLPFAKGIDVVAEEGRLPPLKLALPLRALGRELGMLSRGSNLFRRGEQFVTIDARNGDVRPMMADRLCSYVETLAWTFKVVENKRTGEYENRFSRLGPALAGQILATDDFRENVRELAAVYEMTLPVWRGEGAARTIELLPKGYDKDTKVFTLGTLPFDPDLDPGEAQGWLLDTLKDFAWAEAQESGCVTNSRSLAVHVAGMLAPFCTLLLGEHARRPMFPYLANQSGSGKSLLAKMDLAPVHGEPIAINADQSPEELTKVICSVMLEQRPYLFLDDCGSFKSRVLNMLLTSGRISTRILGKSEMPDLPNRMQIYVTGNGIDIGSELARRAVIADLRYPGEALERTFENVITEEWLYRLETRARFLAVLWAFVRHWRDSHKLKRFAEAQRPSFEDFAAIIGSVVLGAGFANPFGKRDDNLGGDEEGAALRLLLVTVASGADKDSPPEYRPAELLEKAEELGLADAIVGYAKQPAKSLGQKLRLYKGRQFRDSNGRLFEFGQRHGRLGAIYPLRFIDPK